MTARALVALASLSVVACGGSASGGGDVPTPKGEPVPHAAVGAESAGSDPVPTTYRGVATAAPTTRPTPRPPSMKAPPTPSPTATPM